MNLRPSTLAWVGRHLAAGERVIHTEALHGGITAEMRKLTIGQAAGLLDLARGRGGVTRNLVLRSYVEPFAVRHAEDWLRRETYALRVLAETSVSAPEIVAVDLMATQCEYPSLLMTHLPGRTMLADVGVARRVVELAQQLVAIHALVPVDRPPEYRTSTTADSVVIPARADADVWAAAIDLIRGPVPTFTGRFLHRDFQPGNVLFDDRHRITGVVDWAGTSWGPADLDVANCSTNLALLHGRRWGVRFAAAYQGAGGVLAETPQQRQYWQVRAALACSEEVQLWAQPWREAGRTDLTKRVVEDRLGSYVSLLMSART